MKRLQELVGGAGGVGWVAAKAVLMFAVTVAGLRLGERRTLAQLGAFDFAVAVAIGAIIGRTVTSSSASFATGAVALITLLITHRLVAFARRHNPMARLIDHPPRVLVAGGEMQDRELGRAGPSLAARPLRCRRRSPAGLAWCCSTGARGVPTGFVLDPAGKVVVSVYSSGAIGRLVPDDVAGLVRYVREHAAA
jgi:hypothetical protein